LTGGFTAADSGDMAENLDFPATHGGDTAISRRRVVAVRLLWRSFGGLIFC